MTTSTPQLAIGEHASREVARLLHKFAAEVETTRHAPDPEAVHDVRVSIRRLSQCLRVFRPFYPDGTRRRVRKRLRKLMRRAGEVRNRDIAMDLLKSLGVPPNAAVLRRLAGARAEAAGELAAALDRWNARGSDKTWRTKLGV